MAVGYSDRDVIKYGGRVEVFLIAENEQLIGCEIDQGYSSWVGLTWIKVKMR